MGGCELKVFKDPEIQRCSELGKSGHRAQGKGGLEDVRDSPLSLERVCNTEGTGVNSLEAT